MFLALPVFHHIDVSVLLFAKLNKSLEFEPSPCYDVKQPLYIVTKPHDFLSQDLERSRNRTFRRVVFCVALKFDRLFDSTIAKSAFKFLSDEKEQNLISWLVDVETGGGGGE